MDTSKKGQQEYSEMVKQTSPNSPVLLDCGKAFLSGGLICVFGQLLLDFFTGRGISDKDAAMWVSITLIGISAVLTSLGIYEKLGKFCGAGTIVPITGFANSVVSPAIEFKKDYKDIMGTRQKHLRRMCCFNPKIKSNIGRRKENKYRNYDY